MAKSQIGRGSASWMKEYKTAKERRLKLETKIREVLHKKEEQILWPEPASGAKEFVGLSWIEGKCRDQGDNDWLRNHIDAEKVKIIKDVCCNNYEFARKNELWNRWQNWDAVCFVGDTLCLIEAKAYAKEMDHDGDGGKSRDAINQLFIDTLGVEYFADSDKKNCYQLMNRIARAKLLYDRGINVKLIYIFFENGAEKRPDSTKKAMQDMLCKHKNSVINKSKSKDLREKWDDLLKVVCVNVDTDK